MLNISANTDSFATKAMIPISGEVAVADWFQKASGNTGALQRRWNKVISFDRNDTVGGYDYLNVAGAGTSVSHPFIFFRRHSISRMEFYCYVQFLESGNDTARVIVNVNESFAGSLQFTGAVGAGGGTLEAHNMILNVSSYGTNIPLRGTVYLTSETDTYIGIQSIWALEY